jgi:hypothetical protein
MARLSRRDKAVGDHQLMAGRMDELPIDIKGDGGEVLASDEGGI